MLVRTILRPQMDQAELQLAIALSRHLEKRLQLIEVGGWCRPGSVYPTSMGILHDLPLTSFNFL